MCQQCVDDWKKQKQHIDLYAGDSQDKSILTCENSLTQDNGSVVFNPAADLPVDTSPIFDPKSNQCHKP